LVNSPEVPSARKLIGDEAVGKMPPTTNHERGDERDEEGRRTASVAGRIRPPTTQVVVGGARQSCAGPACRIRAGYALPLRQGIAGIGGFCASTLGSDALRSPA
jgi:hypothetical protein